MATLRAKWAHVLRLPFVCFPFNKSPVAASLAKQVFHVDD